MIAVLDERTRTVLACSGALRGLPISESIVPLAVTEGASIRAVCNTYTIERASAETNNGREIDLAAVNIERVLASSRRTP